ncbi:MAG: efflux RND transporter periplasmic adaptor subunit [Armatimonadaceae bacterium]
MKNPFLRWLPIALPFVLIFGIITFIRSRPKTVPVTRPVERLVVESIAGAGRVRGQVETSVGAQTNGRVAAMLVREGDRVQEGQVVARLDTTVLQAQVGQSQIAVSTAETQVAQATDAVETAKAQLEQASRPPLKSDIEQVKAQTAQQVAVAEATLAAARQRLAERERGATREERQALSAQVLQAEANVEQAEREYNRQKLLFDEGAVAKSVLDNAETTLKVARRTLENLQAQQKQQEIGPREELVAQAKADVRAAEATVRGAKATGAAQLESLLSTPRPEDVRVAKRRLEEARQAKRVAEARLREARVALDVAQSRLGDALVRAPFDGTITEIVTEAGGVTGPNQPIVRLVRFALPEVRVDIDEKRLSKLRIGLEGVVSSDAFPDQTFTAIVKEIGAQVDTDRGTVEVRLDPVNPPDWLRPGQTVSVNIIVDEGTRRLVVPLTAVTTIGGTSFAFVIQEGKVARRDVEVGPASPDGFPILAGLSAEDTVIIKPTGLAPGQAVVPDVQENPAAKQAASTGR